MASPKSALSGSVKTPQIVSEDQSAAFQDRVHQRISERAYHIYQNSGGDHGNDFEHWVQAENEVLQRGIEVRESGSWLALNATIPDNSADVVEICLTPSNVVVRTEKDDASGHEAGEREIFLTHDLKIEIEPATASATLKDQKLTIMVKKRFPVSAAAATSPATSSIAQSLAKKESEKA